LKILHLNCRDKIKGNDIGLAYSTHGEMGNSYNILAEKPEGKRPPGRTRCRWEDNIRMDLWEIDRHVWIGFICLRAGTSGVLVNTVMNLRIP